MKDDSSGKVERLYVLAHDQECVKLMCSNLMYDLSHSSPWASDAGLEERHRELASREGIPLSQSIFIDILEYVPKQKLQYDCTKLEHWRLR